MDFIQIVLGLLCLLGLPGVLITAHFAQKIHRRLTDATKTLGEIRDEAVKQTGWLAHIADILRPK